MIYLTHVPEAPLSEFVDWFWYFEGLAPSYTRERVMPHGALELIINLDSAPKRLFDREDYSKFRSFTRSWISGAQSEYLVIDAMPNSSMMGIHFKPGGAYPFFGFPMTELQDSVVELDALWGLDAAALRDRLLELPSAEHKFQALERFLLTHTQKPLRRDARVAFALRAFETAPHARTILIVAERLGVSHKHLIAEFGKWAGLTPKLFCRLRRFQRVVASIEHESSIEWADLACACGYYDQPHFIRDFQAFSGLNPSAYLTGRGEYVNFVPVRE
ncbi:MAG: AraC family transcriptional regulator [Verrucomicrobia bacterium]|nr:AraC family transcriptional regulator [Verrucomicrobiota bacterium]